MPAAEPSQPELCSALGRAVMTLGVRSAAACMILQEQRSVTVLAAGADWVVYQGWWRQRKPICSVGP